MAQKLEKKDNVQYFGMDDNTEYIKIHGLQRSGTNYLSHLMNENFSNTKVMVNLGGWKHGYYCAPWAIGKEVHILIIVKSPYSWLVSMYKYWGPSKKLNIGPDLSGVSFDDFVRNRVYFERQRDVPFLFRCSNPVQHWNNMNFHWTSIRMNEKKLCVIPYETLLINPEKSIKDTGVALGLEMKPKFSDFDMTFMPSGENIKPTGEKFTGKDFYLKGDYINHYTPDLVKFVNNNLDMDLMINFGYEYMSPKDADETQAKVEFPTPHFTQRTGKEKE